jgi:cellulose biosynthesis protein BcsQ
MAIYAVWNNKGGVGKSYLSFQVACEYARQHPDKRVLVLDLCPQANVSGMLLGGMERGQGRLDELSQNQRTIADYIENRIRNPYNNPRSGGGLVIQVSTFNPNIPTNVYLVCGDDQLETQASRASAATRPGPNDAWRLVHTWISDLIGDIQTAWDGAPGAVFIDCNPSFSIYTELALSAADRLIIPFSADGSSRRAVSTLLSLIYGVIRRPGIQQSDFFINAERFRMVLPQIYCYVGNRLTQYQGSATAFGIVVEAIGEEIWGVWQRWPNRFCVHPPGFATPITREHFAQMFQYEFVDNNTSSVVSSTLGIPLSGLTARMYEVVPGDPAVRVNQSQLDVQQPNLTEFVQRIE